MKSFLKQMACLTVFAQSFTEGSVEHDVHTQVISGKLGSKLKCAKHFIWAYHHRRHTTNGCEHLQNNKKR